MNITELDIIKASCNIRNFDDSVSEDVIKFMVDASIKELRKSKIKNPIEELFKRCKKDDPKLTREDFDEALDLYLYRFKKENKL